MSLTVLRAGLDTVEISYAGEISDEVAAELDRLKEHAQLSDSPQKIGMGLLDFYVQPKSFSLWRWRITHPFFSIVARPKAAAGGVVAQVRYSAFGLANEPVESLAFHTRLALDKLGNLTELAVSRADVCVDFQGWGPTPAEAANVVCAAAYRGTHGKEGSVETFQFGKKTLLRIYNKSEELAVSGKEWLYDVWGQSDAFEREAAVWRVEFQASREVLKELGIVSSAVLFANPGALLDYGLRWAQMRVPDGGVNKTRWEEDVRWTALRTASFVGVLLQRSVRVPELMSLDRTISVLIGAAATAGAYFGTTDYMGALQQLSFAAEVHMIHEEIDFAAMVAKRERRILSGSK